MNLSQQNSPDSIETALDYCLDKADNEGITLYEVVEHLGPASYCFICLILSVPFIQPLSLGPLTMASGVAFMTMGWQMTRGQSSPALPGKVGSHRIHGKGWCTVLGAGRSILRFCRRFTRPRYSTWIVGDEGKKRVGWLVCSGGFLLAIPFANIPLSNTFPALMIFFAVLALLEKDGFMVILSLVWGIISLLYFTLISVLLWIFGSRLWDWMIP
jgi:hypothetical protein